MEMHQAAAPGASINTPSDLKFQKARGRPVQVGWLLERAGATFATTTPALAQATKLLEIVPQADRNLARHSEDSCKPPHRRGLTEPRLTRSSGTLP